MPGRGLHPPTQDRGAGGGPRMEEMCAPHPSTQRAGQRGGGRRSAPPTSGSVGPAERRSDHSEPQAPQALPERERMPSGTPVAARRLLLCRACAFPEPRRGGHLQGRSGPLPAGACIPCPPGSSECPENSLPSGHQQTPSPKTPHSWQRLVSVWQRQALHFFKLICEMCGEPTKINELFLPKRTRLQNRPCVAK